MKFHPLIYVLSLLGAPLLLAQESHDDAELSMLRQRFQEQTKALRETHKAALADDLRAARSAGDQATARRAELEIARLRSELKLDQVPASIAATDQTDDEVLDAIFGAGATSEGVDAADFPEMDENAAGGGEGNGERRGPINLAIENATREPESDPGRMFFQPEAQAKWTLDDIQPGKYRVHFLYHAGEQESGGKVSFGIRESGSSAEVDIPAGQLPWDAPLNQYFGWLDIEKTPVTFFVKGVSKLEGAVSIFDLKKVVLYPMPSRWKPQDIKKMEEVMEWRRERMEEIMRRARRGEGRNGENSDKKEREEDKKEREEGREEEKKAVDF